MGILLAIATQKYFETSEAMVLLMQEKSIEIRIILRLWAEAIETAVKRGTQLQTHYDLEKLGMCISSPL